MKKFLLSEQRKSLKVWEEIFSLSFLEEKLNGKRKGFMNLNDNIEIFLWKQFVTGKCEAWVDDVGVSKSI